MQCPDGIWSWSCYSPPAAWMALAKSGGEGRRRLGAPVLLWEKPFPVGIFITSNLMACLSTPPPPPSQPRHMLKSPTDAAGVPPPESLMALVQDAAWRETADNSPGASNEQPGLRTITQTVRFLFPLQFYVSFSYCQYLSLFLPSPTGLWVPRWRSKHCTWSFLAPGDSKCL